MAGRLRYLISKKTVVRERWLYSTARKIPRYLQLAKGISMSGIFHLRPPGSNLARGAPFLRVPPGRARRVPLALPHVVEERFLAVFQPVKKWKREAAMQLLRPPGLLPKYLV